MLSLIPQWLQMDCAIADVVAWVTGLVVFVTSGMLHDVGCSCSAWRDAEDCAFIQIRKNVKNPKTLGHLLMMWVFFPVTVWMWGYKLVKATHLCGAFRAVMDAPIIPTLPKIELPKIANRLPKTVELPPSTCKYCTEPGCAKKTLLEHSEQQILNMKPAESVI